MPIPADPNFPTVAGYVQAVSFFLLNNGEPIRIPEATYLVDNISQLDAHLAVSTDTSGADETTTTEVDGFEEETKPQLYSKATVLIRYDLANDKYNSRDEYTIAVDGTMGKIEDVGANSDVWTRFAYTDEEDPESALPCHSGQEFNRYISFVEPKIESLDEPVLGVRVEFTDSTDNALLTSDEVVEVEGTIRRIEGNLPNTGCVLSDESTKVFYAQGANFKTADYPKAKPSAPSAKVKLLWLAGYEPPDAL